MDSTYMMPRKENEIVATSRVDKLIEFIKNAVSLRRHWALYERMELCNLGHITGNLSETGNATIKRGKFAVHSQMPINVTASTITRIDRVSHANHAVADDRRVNMTPLLNNSQPLAVTSASSFLTEHCVTRWLEPQYEASNLYKVSRISENEWVCTGNENGPCESDNPWPIFNRTRHVKLIDGMLFCDCNF